MIWAVTVRTPLKLQRKRKNDGVTGSRTQDLWLKLLALCHCANTHTESSELSNIREERGGCQCGCRSSVAECWRLKSLGLTPGGTAFLSFPLLFQRFLDCNGPNHLWLDILHQSLDFGRIPSIGLPIAVIPLMILQIQRFPMSDKLSMITIYIYTWLQRAHLSLEKCSPPYYMNQRPNVVHPQTVFFMNANNFHYCYVQCKLQYAPLI